MILQVPDNAADAVPCEQVPRPRQPGISVMHVTRATVMGISAALAAVLAGISLFSITIGAAHLNLRSVLIEIAGASGTLDSVGRTILFDIRLPRVVLAALVGGALSVGGVVFQALLRNPLAEPFILGISGGAAVGSIVAILLGFSLFPGIAGLSFAGGVLTIALVLGISRGGSSLHTNTLLLAGVIVNSFFSAVIMFLLAVTNDARIHNILPWLMGDLGLATFGETAWLGPVVLIACFLIYLTSRSLNLMTIGESAAIHLGVRVERLKTGLFVLVSLIVSASVSLCGIIGFVGLIIPHLLRFMVGADHRLLLPASFLSGASFLVFCDTIARTASGRTELPVGVITALFGCPFFIFLLWKKGR